jgi:alpha-galactosidase
MKIKKDRETWVVTFHSQDNSTKNIDMYIQSDDFFTDARLYLEGDFVSEEEKAEYAQRICNLLNRDFPPIKEQDLFNTPVYGAH